MAFDRILAEAAVARRHLRKGLAKRLAAVVIAEREADRERQSGDRFLESRIGKAVVAGIDQIAGRDQQIGPRLQPGERSQSDIEASAVQLDQKAIDKQFDSIQVPSIGGPGGFDFSAPPTIEAPKP